MRTRCARRADIASNNKLYSYRIRSTKCRRLCDKIAQGGSYAQLVADIKTDFDTPDEYQPAYLITQAANELCPVLIWQLRNSAAGYVAAP